MNNLGSRYIERRTRREREFSRRLLLYCHERTLRDCGFSPELLREGVDAWPWRRDARTELEKGFVDREDGKIAVVPMGGRVERMNPDGASWTIQDSVKRDKPDYEEGHCVAA